MYSNRIVKYIAAFLLIVPILDGLIYFGIQLSVVLKLLFLVSLLIYCLFFYKGNDYYRNVFIIIGSFLYIGVFLYFATDGDLFYELSGILRLFYLPILLITFYCIREQNKEFINSEVIINAACLYAILLLLSYIFQIGTETYSTISTNRFGFRGLFGAANDVSIILGIASGLILLKKYSVFNKYTVLNIAKLLLLIVAMGVLSTKTPFLIILIVLLYKFISNITNLKVVGTMFVILIVFGIFILNSNIAENNKVHTEFIMEKYNIDSVSELYDEPIILVNEYVLSGRLDLVELMDEEYDNSTSLDKVMGIGYAPYLRSAEMDYFEVYYRLGFFGFILYMSILGYGVYINLKGNFITKKSLMIFIVFLISFITGHVLMSVSVSLYVATLVASKELYLCEK